MEARKAGLLRPALSKKGRAGESGMAVDFTIRESIIRNNQGDGLIGNGYPLTIRGTLFTGNTGIGLSASHNLF